jgi:N6-adenosine-specific RNA methylase IME4
MVHGLPGEGRRGAERGVGAMIWADEPWPADTPLIESGIFAGLPLHYFSAISVDPPANFKTRSETRQTRAISRHYKVMKPTEIAKLPVRDLMAKNCWVFYWTQPPQLANAIDVVRHGWGLEYSSVAFTWVKLRPKWEPSQGGARYGRPQDIAANMVVDDFPPITGLTTRKNTESVLLARLGAPKIMSRKVRELIISRRREHSRKPDETPERIMAFCPGPYLELFAREQRPGWTVWGDEVDKFPGAA